MAEIRTSQVFEGVAAGPCHGARVEARDLVAGKVRGNVAQGSEELRIAAYALDGEADFLQVIRVGVEVPAPAAKDDGFFTQEGQGVGDIAGATAAPFNHVVYHEAYVEHVQLVHEHMVLEIAMEIHDAVEGKGTRDVYGHGRSSLRMV